MAARHLLGLARALAVVAAMAFVPPAQGQTIGRWRPFVAEASARCGVPARWIERVIWAESRGRAYWRGRPVKSRAGAMGLMQVMPGTWAALRERLGLGFDPYDPRDNILAGTCYLRLMYDRFGYPGLFGAYNAGPGRYSAYLAGKASLPHETASYLAALGPRSPARIDGTMVRARRGGGIFFSDQSQEEQSAPAHRLPSGMFVTLTRRAASGAQE